MTDNPATNAGLVEALACKLFDAPEPREIAGAVYPEAFDYDADDGRVRRYWEAIARNALAAIHQAKGGSDDE